MQDIHVNLDGHINIHATNKAITSVDSTVGHKRYLYGFRVHATCKLEL